ncbi:MAG: GNAT family N-acetyltransferase [Oscillospiraceae bacterium]|nr:GNAT family N-acetyltransferase [Oscillospiraceae bacterium]
MNDKTIVRRATAADTSALIRLRLDYLTEQGELSPADVQQLRQYFAKHIAQGACIAVLAEVKGEVAGVALLAISEKPANPAFITGVTGTLLNVLTYPAHRGQGIATQVLTRMMDEARAAGVSRIDLSATAAGKTLYKKLGFDESAHTTMGLQL